MKNSDLEIYVYPPIYSVIQDKLLQNGKVDHDVLPYLFA